MNALTGPAEAQALEAQPAFAACSGVALIPADRLAEDYKRVIAGHERERAAELRRERGRWGIVGVLGFTSVALAGALAMAMPLKRILPVFVASHEDGSFTTTIAQSDVPARLRDNTMKATLWLYVTARERFNTATHAEDQQVVYILSDKATGDAYEAGVNYANKRSPWKRYGTRTTVRLQRISEGLGCGTEACAPGQTPNAYSVRYRRFERTEGQWEIETASQSAVRFHLAPEIPVSQQVTYNPMGLQIVQYDRSDEGALP